MRELAKARIKTLGRKVKFLFKKKKMLHEV